MPINTLSETKTTIKQAIDGFLLSCKVEGKSIAWTDINSPMNYQWELPQRLVYRFSWYLGVSCSNFTWLSNCYFIFFREILTCYWLLP